MMLLLFVFSLAVFGIAYATYGRRIARQVGIDDGRVTPANTEADGVDYVPTRPAILFGHHFSSIAGAGPIVGPVIAAMAFGWGPALAWILIGAIFVGGVHDFTALVASIRHGGRSIGQICRSLVHPATYRAMLVLMLMTLIYVIIVFLDLTASSFAPVSAATADVSEAAAVSIREGGAVATASILYIALAVLFGVAMFRFRMPTWLGTLIFVPLTFAGIYWGYQVPLTIDMVPAFLGSQKNFWSLLLLGYCMAASVLPVWVLLQPRDYLASFLLYACLLGGVAGLATAGVTGHAPIQYPAWVGWTDAQLGFVFPALFVTIACGAVSGFHSIVASGTSSKQLDAERNALPIGYGSMLVEGVLAVIAVTTVMMLPGRSSGTPVRIFAEGLGHLFAGMGFDASFATVFAMLAVSTFLLTTLDTCTRLARFLLQELIGANSRLTSRLFCTIGVLVLPVLVVFREVPGPGGAMMPAWKAIWPAFGASNQLLAALALLVVYGWMRRSGKRALFVLIPMIFMCVTTLSALALLAWKNLARGGSGFVGGISLVLGIIAIVIITDLLLMLRGAGISTGDSSSRDPAA